MSKPLEGVSEKIETCAKKEFLEKGYVDASLRNIAAKAGTTTGSIYSRYGGKEGLFSAIVEAVAEEFVRMFRGIQEKFQLLVDGSYGTKFQNFVEHLVEIETEYTVKYMETAGIDPQKESPITSEFSHIMNKALFESFFEVVRHNMPKDEALRYIDMLAKYHCAGWRVIYEKD